MGQCTQVTGGLRYAARPAPYDASVERVTALWRNRAGVVLPVLTLVAFLARPLGVPALVMLTLAGWAWVHALRGQWRLGAALGIVVTGWVTLTFAVFSVSPLLPWDMNVILGVAIVVATFASMLIQRTDAREASSSTGAVLAAFSGAVLWLVGAGLAMILPNGSGLSWAAFTDSSLDVLNILHVADANGVAGAAAVNPRPLEHALSSSFLPIGYEFDASSAAFMGAIETHAWHWLALVALTCVMAGLVVDELIAADSRWKALRFAAIAAVSCGVLLGPVSGFALYRGQINAHLVWVLVLSAVHIALGSRKHPLGAAACLALLTTALLLTWTPFAAVPGVMLIWVLVGARASLRQMRPHDLAYGGAVAIYCAWAFTTYTLSDLVAASTSADASQRRVTVPTVLPNPAWIPLTVALACAVVLLAVTSRRLSRVARTTAVLTVCGLVLGSAPLWLARGSLTGELEYYPSRYVHMATSVMAALLAGLVVSCLAEAGPRRVVAAIAAVGVGTLALIAPINPIVQKWNFVPWDVSTGRWYGTAESMSDKIHDYADPHEIRLAWSPSVDNDYYVNWMLAIYLSVTSSGSRAPVAAELRMAPYATTDEHACTIGRLAPGLVTLMTDDADLEVRLGLLCPETAPRVELLPPTS